MVTGDFLFEPRKGQTYDKDDDHLAQMMELLGRMPANLALSGKHSRKYFDSKANLRRIKGLCFWPVKKVLTDKYLIHEEEAQAFADFLMPMLTWHHDRRATAEEMLKHPWLNMPDVYNFKYTKAEYEKIQFKKSMQGASPDDDNNKQEMGELIDSDPELNQADIE
jgi:serine/threonine-protein kinase SRPK3